MPKVHIGKKIKEVLDKSALSAVDFAKSISLTRNGAYKVFEKETIDTGQLQKISKVLNHDFFSYYHINSAVLQEPEEKIRFITASELAQSNRELLNAFKSEINQLREELSLKKDSYKPKAKARKKVKK
jgi:hypothetical protein